MNGIGFAAGFSAELEEKSFTNTSAFSLKVEIIYLLTINEKKSFGEILKDIFSQRPERFSNIGLSFTRLLKRCLDWDRLRKRRFHAHRYSGLRLLRYQIFDSLKLTFDN